MRTSINLSGEWLFHMDADKETEQPIFNEKISLPSTTSFSEKGPINTAFEINHLTDLYAFEGWAWFQKEIEIPVNYGHKTIFLFLERTRMTTVWVDDQQVGSQNSLSTPHRYNLSDYLSPGKHILRIRVDNTNYPTKGGHLTSRDTQSNWNGIVGEIALHIYENTYLDSVKIDPHLDTRSIIIKGSIIGQLPCSLRLSAKSCNGQRIHVVMSKEYFIDEQNFSLEYTLGEDALLWDEYTPHVYKLTVELMINNHVVDILIANFGLREFRANGNSFTINGRTTFLRGKHDGLIFPHTGFAPMEVEEWLKVFTTAKEYGINHYRFHTCCPPQAAFDAADQIGIYLQPELPFWGTITTEEDERHDQEEQDYLIKEGFKILKNYANHPSFVMFSLGNELWGNKERIRTILADYKAVDSRPLYVQGSNNFQFSPCILPEDDFFSGVRFAKDRLIRGSYAMCDAPLGVIQTQAPNTQINFDKAIIPTEFEKDKTDFREDTVEIQFGVTTKTVKLTDTDTPLIPLIPVVSHEIGQYQTFPNFDEIAKYTGPLRARNLEVFRERLRAKGLLDLAHLYFKASGKFAVACYKQEIEAAIRSKNLAGFQLLDLQDFTGQGTALVGVLDAFMESKGMVTAEKWREFCSDTVLLGKFEKYIYESGERFRAAIALAYYQPIPLEDKIITWQLSIDQRVIEGGEITIPDQCYGLVELGEIMPILPQVEKPTEVTFTLQMDDTVYSNSYTLMVYPKVSTRLERVIEQKGQKIYVVRTTEEAISLLAADERVLLLPSEVKESIPGCYCTDFWCYPMFRSISEAMHKPVPVGTLGLLIDHEHKALAEFPSQSYSTPQWYHLVSHASCEILDHTPSEFRPIVQVIDNFERNHKLGILYEANVLKGKILVCTVRLDEILGYPEVQSFIKSLLDYGVSEAFNPIYTLEVSDLK